MENNELMQLEKTLTAFEGGVNSLVIANKDDLTRAGDILFQVKDFIKKSDAKKKELVKPFKDAIRKLENEFDPKIDKAKEIKSILDGKISAYQMEVLKKQQEEEKLRREQELLRLEHLKEELEEKAAKENNSAILNEAIKVEERQERMMSEPIKTSQSARGDISTTTLSMVWDYRIKSENKIPREYCSPDLGKLRRAVNDGERTIPGVVIFQKPRVINRV